MRPQSHPALTAATAYAHVVMAGVGPVAPHRLLGNAEQASLARWERKGGHMKSRLRLGVFMGVNVRNT
eukprot:1199381-Amphidinium_carterae.1